MNRIAAGNLLLIRERSSTLGGWSALFILAKPGIVAAVTLSGYTGMVLAGRALPNARLSASCLASLLLMAAGSALVNSVLDQRMDRCMERLALRNAALERIGTGCALACAALCTCCALALAGTQLNSGVVLLLLAASLSYALCYTVSLKPRTHWAAVLGGVPGALPVLVGSAAAAPAVDGASLMLFLVLLIWQPPHFWLLALSHLEQYRAAGVPVLPLVKGVRFTRSCICFGTLALIPASELLWLAGPCSRGYALCALALGVFFLVACRHYLGRKNGYRLLFRGSIIYLLGLLTTIIVDLIR
jgi:heme o synthase